MFGTFQSLYDIIPHDVDRPDLHVLAVRGLDGRFTSERWPYWNATEDARENCGGRGMLNGYCSGPPWPSKLS